MIEVLEEAFNKAVQRYITPDESDEEISIEYNNLQSRKSKKSKSSSAEKSNPIEVINSFLSVHHCSLFKTDPRRLILCLYKLNNFSHKNGHVICMAQYVQLPWAILVRT